MSRPAVIYVDSLEECPEMLAERDVTIAQQRADIAVLIASIWAEDTLRKYRLEAGILPQSESQPSAARLLAEPILVRYRKEVQEVQGAE